MGWYLESALGYESGSICICHIYPYLLGEKMFNTTWLTFWKSMMSTIFFLPHLRCISLQNRVISVVISMLLEVFAVFFIKIVLFIRWISGNPGKLPGAMTSPPAATAAPHRGSSAVNWLPWLLASRLNGSIEGDRWNWVGGWNSLAGGEVTALIFSLIFFCWLFNFWSTYPRILPWKETCSLKINGWKMYFLLK